MYQTTGFSQVNSQRSFYVKLFFALLAGELLTGTCVIAGYAIKLPHIQKTALGIFITLLALSMLVVIAGVLQSLKRE